MKRHNGKRASRYVTTLTTKGGAKPIDVYRKKGEKEDHAIKRVKQRHPGYS